MTTIRRIERGNSKNDGLFSAPLRLVRSHPAILVFVVAFTIRFSVAVVVAVTRNGYLFPDDRGYLNMASEFANGHTNTWEMTNTWGLWNINASFLAPIAYLFHYFGSHALIGQTLSALAGATTAAAVAALVHRHTSAIAALFSGLIVAVFPSQVLWSSIVLKDPFSWMAISLLALVLGWWANKSGLIKFAAGFLMLSSLTFFLAHLRVHTLTTACIAGTIALLLTARRHRIAKVFTLLVLLAVMPLSVGAGFFSHNTFALTSNLEGIRSNMAFGARTAIRPSNRPDPANDTGIFLALANAEDAAARARAEAAAALEAACWLTASDTGVGGDAAARARHQAVARAREKAAAALEVAVALEAPGTGIGGDTAARAREEAVAALESCLALQVVALRAVQETGTEARRADAIVEELETAVAIEQTVPELGASGTTAEIRYLPTGLRVMLLDPLPNHLTRSPNMKYPFAEHLLWYPLLILALIGTVVRRKNPTPELVYTLFVTGGLAIMWGLVEGNFGTAYRHRGELIWGVAVLAGIGLDHLLKTRYPTARILSKSSSSQ